MPVPLRARRLDLRKLTLICCYIVGAICAVLSGALADSPSGTKQSDGAAQPKLVRVSVYTWALSGGRITADLQGRRLQALGFITREPRTNLTEKDKEDIAAKKAQRGWPMIEAEIAASEVQALSMLVQRSDLRSFKPDMRYIKDRKPYCDEGQPDLVLTLEDCEMSFELPLDGTVKGDAPDAVKKCYRAMEDICAFLFHLEREYRRPQHFSVVPMDSPMIKAYERDMDSVLHNPANGGRVADPPTKQ